jgi:hypothetical protein
MRDSQISQERFLELEALGAIHIARFLHKLDVLLYRQPADDAWVLRQICHAMSRTVVKGHVGDVEFIERDPAPIHRKHSGQQVESRGFAGAIGTQESYGLAPVHGETDIVEDLASVEGLGHRLHRKHRMPEP